MSKTERSVADRIRKFNAGRDPELVQRKYALLRSSLFAFLRGTCHLFYAELPKTPIADDAPPAWICGDLHLSNFGAYKGDNRLVYFDINDFDEAVLAPCTWELVRLLASVLIAAQMLGVKQRAGIELCRRVLAGYIAAIEEGKPRWIERDLAEGMIGKLLDRVRRRKRKALLDRRTHVVNGKRRILIDGRHALPISRTDRSHIASFMRAFARKEGNPRFYKLLDVARRVAGTGSLGVKRYVLLVEGKGSPDANYLLDLKQALPSSLLPRLKVRQPRWDNEAQRVVTVQRRDQAISMAFLRPVMLQGEPYVLRGLQPIEDRLALGDAKGHLDLLRELMGDLGKLVAWAQLRGSGRQGAATADELARYWNKRSRPRKLMALVRACTEITRSQWREYCRAYDAGDLE